MLVLCWPKVALCCPMLTLCWPKLPLSCPYVDPMFTYVGLGNALPHSSDRNGGGGDGVGRGSPDQGARLYNLRLPPKASGKDTGCGSWAGARIKGYRPCRRPLQFGGGVGCNFQGALPSSIVGDSAAETRPTARIRNGRTAARWRRGAYNGFEGRGPFSTFEPAKSKELEMDGWGMR